MKQKSVGADFPDTGSLGNKSKLQAAFQRIGN
jgi:hypothetical protein